MTGSEALRLRIARHALIYWLDVAYMRRVGRHGGISVVYRTASIRAYRDLAHAGYDVPDVVRLWRAALRGDLATLAMPEPTGNAITRRRAAPRQAALPLYEADGAA